MKKHLNYLPRSICVAACALISLSAASNLTAAGVEPLDISLTPIGRHTNNAPFNLSAAEIVTHDPPHVLRELAARLAA